MIAHPHHVFWAENVSLGDAAFVSWERVAGHRQVTDSYLFALTLRHGGRLATLDQGIASLARDQNERKAIELITVV